MNRGWLHSYLVDATRRKLCTRIHCTTCGAMAFRQGVFRALAKATDQGSPPTQGRESVVRIAQALAAVRPSGSEVGQLELAARCLVFDICRALGETETENILGDSWGGDVLGRMQAHHRSVLAARRAREEYESPERTRARREERKRVARDNVSLRRPHPRMVRRAGIAAGPAMLRAPTPGRGWPARRSTGAGRRSGTARGR